MELDLGVKLKRAADDFTSDFRFAKDRAGPVFVSHETDSLFILTARLKGYKRSNIRIDINEDGTLIAISGEKHVRETVVMGWQVYKKDTEIKEFKKVFRIPDGVILDGVKARFNEDDSTLKISMPKKVRGIRGTPMEEVKEEENEDLVKEDSGNLQILDEEIQKTDENQHDVKNEQNVIQEKEDQKTVDSTVQESTEAKELDHDQEQRENIDQVSEEAYRIDEKPEKEEQEASFEVKRAEEANRSDEKTEKEEQEASFEVKRAEEANRVDEKTEKEEQEASFEVKRSEEAREGGHVTDKPRSRGKRCKMFAPIVAGSVVLVVSCVVFAVHMIRSKTQTSRRKH